MNTVFDDADVVLSPVTPEPPLRVGELSGKGWFALLLAAQRFAAFTTLWNLMGNPAVSLPAGFTGDGLPLAVQSERPWADRRPPTAG